MLTFMWVAYYTALPHVALSVAAAVYYTLPLFITLFAALFIGEMVGVQGWIAVFLGFCGVLLILKPQAEDFNAYALLPLISAILYAFAMIITRTKCKNESPLVLSVPIRLMQTPTTYRANDAPCRHRPIGRSCKGLSDTCRDEVTAAGSVGRCRTSLRGGNRGPDRRGVGAGYGDLTVGCGRARFGRGGASWLRRPAAADRQGWAGIFVSHGRDWVVSRGAVPGFGRAPPWPVESRRCGRLSLPGWLCGIVVMFGRSRLRRSAAPVAGCRARRSR